jgi:glycosyltransferase involved in cell wall biosynthesis
MPRIWDTISDAELWIVGSDPPKEICELSKSDERVKVTGFVEDAKSVLERMSIVVCPWRGLYGFRSRLIEVMAIGVPLVTNHDAVYGMDLFDNNGISLGETNSDLGDLIIKLINDRTFAEEQSRLARAEIERNYSFQNTYGRLACELTEWLDSRKPAIDAASGKLPFSTNGHV